MSEIFSPSGSSRIGTRTSFLKLTQSSRKTSLGQRSQSLSLTRGQLFGINYPIMLNNLALLIALSIT